MNNNNLCGHCLHSKECHTSHNGHFMYCCACFSLCDNIEFEEKHSPTPMITKMEQSVKIEYTKYIPTELKEMAKREKISLEELWKRYE